MALDSMFRIDEAGAKVSCYSRSENLTRFQAPVPEAFIRCPRERSTESDGTSRLEAIEPTSGKPTLSTGQRPSRHVITKK